MKRMTIPVLAVLAGSLAACTTTAGTTGDSPTTTAPIETSSTPADEVAVRGRGWRGGSADTTRTTTTVAPANGGADVAGADLTDAEIADLVYLREEEKLAHDVYAALYDIWGSRVFDTISRSETNHMESVVALLDRFGIPDPVGDNPAGVFTDPDLRALYAELVQRGALSLEEALGVGTFIEEVDIADLLESLDETEDPETIAVLERLLAGSSNHLRAFVSRLEQGGIEFEPQALDAQAVEEILADGAARSGGRSRGRGA